MKVGQIRKEELFIFNWNSIIGKNYNIRMKVFYYSFNE